MDSRVGAAVSGRVAAPIRSFGSIDIYPKLAINKPGDAYEQEADRVADQVMNSPSPKSPPVRITTASATAPQRECASCEQERKCTSYHEEGGGLDRKQTDAAPAAVPPIVDEVLRSPGQPLDPASRAFMEPRFGQDFGKVRIHTDQRAALSASAIHALAYTVGESIVFGPGQHSPNTRSGRHLLAHELAHVVQQGQRTPSLIRRKATKADEANKVIAVKHHEAQQKRVAQFLSNALNIKPDPAKGPLDPDNLYHNTAELVDRGKTALKVLTPTHYSQLTNPIYFDDRVTHPTVKGDYPADPAQADLGLVRPPTAGAAGQTDVPKQPVGLTPSPPKEEHSPSRVDPSDTGKRSTPPKVEGTEPPKTSTPSKPATPPVIAWSAAEVKLFTGTSDITEPELKNPLVHEGQHVADWIYLRDTKPATWETRLEIYRSEFRAFWIQPPIPRQCADCPIPEQSPFPDPKTIKKSEKQRSVSLASGQGCAACGGTPAKSTASATTSQVTAMKNDRQEAIFWHLLNLYPQNQFDCFYVCNKNFRDAVDAFDNPGGTNVVNSARLIEFNVELQKLTPASTRAQIGQTKFQSAIEKLDPIDWAFLRDEKLSDPFWSSVKGFAPAPLFAAFKALAAKGNPAPKDISQALERALAKLKAS